MATFSPIKNKLMMQGGPAPGPYQDASAEAYPLGTMAPSAAPKSPVNPLAFAANFMPQQRKPDAMYAFAETLERTLTPDAAKQRLEEEKSGQADKLKQGLAFVQQLRALPANQRYQMAQAGLKQFGLDASLDPQGFTDEALAQSEAALSAQMGIGPEKPAGPDYQFFHGQDGFVGRGDKTSGEFNVLQAGTPKPPEPQKPTEWKTQIIGNRVMAYNPQDPTQTRDMGPAPQRPSGASGGLTSNQALQAQFKLDDLDRDLSEKERLRQASLASISETLALARRFSSPEEAAKFNATYGNVMNPTGKKDDLFNWSVAMDSNRADGMAILEQLGGAAFLDSIQAMKGSGSLSDAEGARVTAAATRLMTVTMSDQEAAKAAQDFIQKLERYEKALKADLEKTRRAEVARRQQMNAMMGRAAAGGGEDLTSYTTEELEQMLAEQGQ